MESKGSIRFRPYLDVVPSHDEERVIKLRDQCFPEILDTEKSQLAYWRWKHHRSDARKNTIALLAVDDATDQILGFYGAIPLSYQGKDGPIKVGLVCDVMTSPEHQGKGIFTRLGVSATDLMLSKHFDMLTGYPIRPNVMPGHRKTGWSFTHKLNVYVGIGGTLSWIKSRWNKKCRQINSEPCEVIEILNRPDFIVFYRKWLQIAKRNRWLYHELTDQFLNWRYTAPGVSYVAVVAQDRNKQIVGYLVARKMKIGYFNVIVIGDLRVLCKEATPSLIAALVKHFKRRNVIVAGMFSTEVVVSSDLVKSGLFKSPRKFQLIQKSRDQNLINNNIPYLSWSDTDDI
jgi:hypothetical protein